MSESDLWMIWAASSIICAILGTGIIIALNEIRDELRKLDPKRSKETT